MKNHLLIRQQICILNEHVLQIMSVILKNPGGHLPNLFFFLHYYLSIPVWLIACLLVLFLVFFSVAKFFSLEQRNVHEVIYAIGYLLWHSTAAMQI